MDKYVITNREQDFQDIGWQDFATLKDLRMFIDFTAIISVDTETTGLSFMDSELMSVQIGCPDKAYLIDCETVPEWAEAIGGSLMEKLLIFQNAAFDLPFLYSCGIVPKKIHDTLLAEIVLSLGVLKIDRDLGSLVKRYLDVDLDKSMQSEIHKVGLLNYEALDYALNDVLYLEGIMEQQLKLAEKRESRKAIDLENEFVKVVAYTEYCGIYFDDKDWMKVVRKNEYEEYGAWLDLIEYTNKKLGIEDAEDINWNSTQQVIPVLEKMGVNTFSEKDKKNTLNKNFLKKQAKRSKVVRLYLDYKEKAKAVSTYGRNWLEYPFEDGRIHTKFKQLVRSARMSCGNVSKGPFPNIQNLPKEKKVRASFKGKGANVLITCDYSGMENVVMADKSQEPKLLDFYMKGGGDGHSYTAKLIWKNELKDLSLQEIKDKHPEKRQKAKAAGFAIQFGGSGYTVADNLNISQEEGERVYNAYMRAYPQLNKYFDKVFSETMKKGYILVNQTTGLKRYIEGMREYKRRKIEDRKFEGAIYRMSLNTPVQATSAQITKTAGIYFFNWIVENGRFGKTRIANIVHDEYVVEENGRKAEETAKVLQECMEKAGRGFLKTLTLKAEPEIHKVWQK